MVIGENNTGKTNMLEALGLIFSQDITFFKKRILESEDINYEVVQNFKRDLANPDKPLSEVKFPEVKVEVTMTGFTREQEAVVSEWFVDTDLSKARLTYSFSLRQGWAGLNEWMEKQRAEAIEKDDIDLISLPISQYYYSIYAGGNPANRADGHFLRMLKMECLDAFRDAKRELIANGDYRLLYRILRDRGEGEFGEIRTALVALNDLVDEHPELADMIGGIKAYLDRISLQKDGEDNSVQFNFSSPEVSEILKKLSLIYGANPIGVERNGLGRNNLLFMALILSHLCKQTDSGDSTYFRLIGIEEPEAHLHPHLQSHLAKNIKSEANDTTQIIVTSHSPYIAGKLDLANTHILYQTSSGIEEHPILKGLDPATDSVNYLRKFLDATNSTMFFAKKVILVEGAAEDLLIPELFEIYTAQCGEKKSLEKIGCNVVNVRGVAFRHFLNIIKNGYFIKCAALTDSDPETPGHNRADDLRSYYETDPGVIKIYSTETATFEKDLISSNRSGAGKAILINALCLTRPRLGAALRVSAATQDIDVDTFFGHIEDEKSEFALNLMGLLKDDCVGFVIPTYIQNAFSFLLG